LSGFDTAQVLSLFIGTVLPLLVGWVTKESWSAGAKAVTLAFLSAVSGFSASALDAVQADKLWDWRTSLVTVLGTFLVAVGIHFGIWKPVGASAAVQRSGVRD
jgi:protein-S-isoprenylcysteine O-methyltransferase Ste14